jgi:hypothetical protein
MKLIDKERRKRTVVGTRSFVQAGMREKSLVLAVPEAICHGEKKP